MNRIGIRAHGTRLPVNSYLRSLAESFSNRSTLGYYNHLSRQLCYSLDGIASEANQLCYDIIYCIYKAVVDQSWRSGSEKDSCGRSVQMTKRMIINFMTAG